MKKSVMTLAVSGLIMLSMLAGCTSSATPTPAPVATTPGATAAPTATPEVTPAPQEPQAVTVRDSDGKDVSVNTHPKKVAIYDYSILDILLNVGFENTGITQLIVPTKDSLPADLDYFKTASDSTVVSGGSLFYVDWDVLDLVQPDLVILGARSFGMNAAGDRLSGEDKDKYVSDTLSRYPQASFLKLTTTTSDAQLLADMENNVAALAAIFPELSDALEAKLAQIKQDMKDIETKAQASGKTALFAMMVDQTTLSIFNPSSRFDMLYEEFGFTPVDNDAVSWSNQHGFDVRAEYVLEKNPDVIFVLDRSATVGTGAGMENFMNDPIIKKTQASLNGDIYPLTGDAWYTMTGGFTAAERMIADINQFFSKAQ